MPYSISNFTLLTTLKFSSHWDCQPQFVKPRAQFIKICYQNVQGLIPIKDLTLKQASLNVTKIYEFNSYININNPDIIMLNETWLRKCVRKGAEILAIEVTIDNKKFVFCTVYRVGNLDEPNHTSIINTIKTFYTVRDP